MAWREDAHFGKLRSDKLYFGKSGNWVQCDKTLRSLADPDYFYSNFRGTPLGNVIAGGAASGTGAADNILLLAGQAFFYTPRGTQTITIPQRVAAGLDIGMDQTDNDGVELSNGQTVALAKKVFVVGTDDPFFFKVKFSIADVSGTDDCAIGFRKAEADQANIDDYDEMAALNVISGNITIETILNNAATTSTDTTDNWADAATHTLEVRVGATGAVTYLIDDAAPTTTAAFSFDSGENVVPFMFFLNATDLAGAVTLQEWEWGYL